MKIKKVSSSYLLLLAIVVLLVSCAPLSKTNTLVGTTDCKPPCWMNIQPGITKKEDAITRLTEREQRGDGSLTLLESGIVRWQSTDGYNSYIYSVDSELVVKTEVDLRSTSIHLDDLISIFGAPSKLDIGKISDGYFFATIFYPEKGLAFVVGGTKFDLGSTTSSFVFQSNMEVVKGLFFQPLDVAAMVNLLYGVNAIPEALSDIQDWIGYSVYSE